METTRTRFAPSPTGALHVGAVRTALFAWLVARHDNGQFILRIEDTDKSREVEGSVDNIIESLRYVGIDWDEGPGKEGKTGPYLQSQRLDIYKEWANKLVASGRAYADPYSEKELNELREKAKLAKKPFLFRNYRPTNPPKWDGSQPLRLLSEPKDYHWQDEVMGEMSTGPEAVDDFILIKSDGYPTYNFAHIVDDALMDITYVIRAQEFIASVPRYLNLYEALNLPFPKLATLPPILDDKGQKKLSKRDGAKQIVQYRDMGIIPEALINFMATLGWNDGTTQEVFTVKELIEKFDLKRVQTGGARFDEGRLLFMNGIYIRKLSLDELFDKVKNYWPDGAKNYDDDYRKRVLSLIQERLKYFAEIPGLSEFFFKDLPIDMSLINENKYLKKLEKTELRDLLEKAKLSLGESDFSLDDLTNRLNELLTSTNQKPAILFSLIRIATTQAPASPGLADTLMVLGKERSLSRIDKSLESLS